MRLEVNRYYIQITPENKVDEAYIEEVLGLKNGGDKAVVERVNAIGLSCIAYVKINKNSEVEKGE